MAQTAKQLERKSRGRHSLLKALRLRHGLQVQAVAAIVGIDQSYLSLLENRKRKPSLGVAKQLAKFYATKVERLFP